MNLPFKKTARHDYKAKYIGFQNQSYSLEVYWLSLV